ncbi:hypothetical protein DM48_603 [Burkholderia gladioli]|uniref:Uncharacterized protein n=1 Tax=Burkholderia gladioli TaxID=28095 RepID=A0AAW3F556_BURGA|nr:hypothetical protein DM48_603 [Burkholderia gladioli]
MAAGQQLVDHAAERIDVVAHRRIGAADHLQARVGRRQRAQRAGVEHRLVAGRARARVAGAGDAEVEHLGHAVARDHHVARLEIGMHDAARVGTLQRARHALDQRPGLAKRHARGPLADQRAQVGAVDVLHGHEDDGAVLVEIVDMDDVIVGQALRAAGLALQRDQRIGMAPELVVEHLHGHEGIAVACLDLALVARQVDHAHAAAAELALEQEAALEQGADARVIAALGVRHALPALAAQAVGLGAAGGRRGAHHHRRVGVEAAGGAAAGGAGAGGTDGAGGAHGAQRAHGSLAAPGMGGLVIGGARGQHHGQVAVGGHRAPGGGGDRARGAAARRGRGQRRLAAAHGAFDEIDQPLPLQAAGVQEGVRIVHRESFTELRAARSRRRCCRARGATSTVRTGDRRAAGAWPARRTARRVPRRRVPC